MSALQDVDRLYSVPEPSFSDIDDSPPEHYSRSGIPTAFSRGHHHNDSYDSTVPLTQPNASYARNDSPTRRIDTSTSEFPPPRPLQSSPIRKPLHSPPSRLEDHDIDPRCIADDGDDVFDSPSKPSRKGYTVYPDAAAVPIAGTGFLPKAFASRDASGNYGPLPGGGSEASRGFDGRAEKNMLLASESRRRKKRIWIILGVIAALAVLGAVGGVVGYMVSRKNSANSSPSSSSSTSSSTGSTSDGNLDANSQEVKDLLGNTNLHRVFPGMDYTPLNAQYPACLTVPPSQNNVTLDIAMLSQLAPAIRLYGTDCKQTEMVLTAIDRLNMNDTVKVWLGVWLENNSTTNTRQLAQMYDILTTYPSSHFEGVIVGNEVLFREDLTLTQLGTVLKEVRSNLTNLNIDLPVATSDLGDNWTAGLASDTDIVMANIHPFFAGVMPDAATAWTWEFWQQHDVVLMTDASKTSTGTPRNIISEVGWPSSGGNDCGTTSGCPNSTAGSVAGIDEMNTFLDSWVCEAMQNGTTYFWYVLKQEVPIQQQKKRKKDPSGNTHCFLLLFFPPMTFFSISIRAEG